MNFASLLRVVNIYLMGDLEVVVKLLLLSLKDAFEGSNLVFASYIPRHYLRYK